MSRLILAYDLGTGGNKASLYDESGNCVASTFVPYETAYPNTGWHEQRPMDWWDAVVQSTKVLLAKRQNDRDRIVIIALSGQSLGVVPLDSKGGLLREFTPIWSDTRAREQARGFFNSFDEGEWYRMTGNGFSRECYPVFKIMWYRDNEPDLFKRCSKMLGSKDFINFKLTGQILTDYSYASGSGVYELNRWNYSSALITRSGLDPGLFPDIVPSTSVLGTLSREASEVLNIPSNVQVVCGGVDNSCMALGAGNIAEGRVYLSLGSSAWIAVSSEKPIVDPEVKPFVFAHVIPAMFTSATSIFSAGSSLKWVRDVLCADLRRKAENKGKDPYDMMIELARNSPAGANNLLFNPSLAGGSAAHLSPRIRGGFMGLDLLHTRSDIIRAAMEGISMDLKRMYDKLKKLCPLEEKLLLVGGGGKSRIWRQMFADIFNTAIVRATVDQEAGSLGAAAVAAVGAGIWKDFSPIDDIVKGRDVSRPDPVAVGKYERILPIFERYLEQGAELGELMTQL